MKYINVKWEEAACREADPEIFFTEDRKEESEALALCDRCPIQLDCMDYAVTNREVYGTWGGTTQRQRRARFWPSYRLKVRA